MRSILLTLSLLLLSCIPVAAQKNVDVDNFRFNVVYRTAPAKPMNPLFFHYGSQVNATKSTEQRVSIAEIDDALRIAAQRKEEDLQPGDLLLSVNLGDLIVRSSNIQERREERKDKEGKVTDVYYYYKVEAVYNFSSSYKIMQGDKVLEQGSPYSSMSNQYYTSSEYGSRKEAADFWNNNRDVLISQFAHDLSMKTAQTVSSRAGSLFGFPEVKDYDILKIIDEKKHPENEPFRAAVNSLKEELQAMTPETGMNRERVDGIIEYFKGIPQKYTDPKLKADVRLRYAAYYNLCKIYIYLDEPEKVAEYADLILKNGHDTKDCERMNKAADELKAVLAKTEVKTRHFNPDDYFNN